MEVVSSSTPATAKHDKSLENGGAAGSRSRKRRWVCVIGGVLAVVIGIVVLALILAFTVFKAKHPVTTADSVALRDFDFSLDIGRMRVNLNISLDVDLSITNPNKVAFKYSNSTALLYYRGDLVGEAPIPSGEISADQTVPINITLVILADRLLSNSQVYSDVVSGTLPFNTFTRISGKVIILGIFKIHVVSTTSCDITVDVTNRAVANQNCNYYTKL